jgi:hypothetical protein
MWHGIGHRKIPDQSVSEFWFFSQPKLNWTVVVSLHFPRHFSWFASSWKKLLMHLECLFFSTQTGTHFDFVFIVGHVGGVLDAYIEGGPLLKPSGESVNKNVGSHADDPVVPIVEESSMTYADGTYAVCF